MYYNIFLKFYVAQLTQILIIAIESITFLSRISIVQLHVPKILVIHWSYTNGGTKNTGAVDEIRDFCMTVVL